MSDDHSNNKENSPQANPLPMDAEDGDECMNTLPVDGKDASLTPVTAKSKENPLPPPCHRPGHIGSQCKGRPRCLICGKDRHDKDKGEECPHKDYPPKCINCDGNHRATSINCPIILQQKQINELAASKNMSYIEAKREIKGASLTGDPRLDFVNFPLMNPPHTASTSPTGSIYSPPLQNKFSLLSSECDVNMNANSGQVSSAFKTLVITNRISTLLQVIAVTLITFPSQGHNSSFVKTKILQWNSRGIQGKLPDIQSIAGKYDILCIQETLLTEGKNINLPFIVYDSIEAAAISMPFQDDELIVLNIYRHPNNDTPAQAFNDLFNFASGYKYAIIMRDFNAHHRLWWCSHNDSVGGRLASRVDAYNFLILNDRTCTRFNPNNNSGSVIDLAIASPDLASYCCTHVLDDPMASDHFPVETTINGNIVRIKRFAYKLKLSKEQLDELGYRLTKIQDKAIVSSGNELEDYETMINCIRDTATEILREDGKEGHKVLEASQQTAIDKLCPPSCSPPPPPPLHTMKEEDKTLPNMQHWMTQPFTANEFKSALASVKVTSSPGLDQMSYAIIKALPEKYKDQLLDLYNKFMVNGTFPNSWRESLVVLIPKPNSNGVRPISLMSCLLKLLEKCIYNRLRWHLEANDILSETQFSFRSFRSCSDSLVILINAIHQGFIDGKFTVCAFLDIAGAFDNVRPEVLDEDLRKVGVPASMRCFISNLLRDRRIFFSRDGDIQGSFNAHKGTPQGSILSPLLYNLYTRDIDRHLNPGVHSLEYADDVMVYFTHKSIKEAFRLLKNSLKALNSFLRARGLDLAPAKSRYMIFTRKRTYQLPEDSITIDGVDVPLTNEHRVLGIIMDSKLTGKAHMKYLLNKGRKISSILTVLSGFRWGCHPQLLLTLYRAVFRSAIEYGCVVFKFKGNKQLFLAIQRLQWKLLRYKCDSRRNQGASSELSLCVSHT
ncbi:uncharacterized protein [Temnothorax nylanderi]|uniref:uncharacterized protein n=1 Tax=Temnothorax nylanderi TaxID=102681 RepID=UPI003A87763B